MTVRELTVKPQSASFELLSNDLRSASALSRAVKDCIRAGTSWGASLSWETVRSADVQGLTAFLNRASQGGERVFIRDHAYDARVSLGSYGVPTVNGASQSGRSLVTDNWAAGYTVAAGLRFVLGGRLYEVAEPVVTDATGAATLALTRPLVGNPTDNALLRLEDVGFVGYLNQGGVAFSSRPPALSGTTVEFLEDLTVDVGSVPYRELVVGRDNKAALSTSVTFTRAGAGYALNAAGVYASHATDVPRFEYDASGNLLGLLREGARTNLLSRSNEFDHANWGKTRSTVTANAAVGPDGNTTADKLVEDSTAAATHYLSQAISKAGSSLAYAGSIFLKAGERTKCRVVVSAGSGSGNQIRIDVDLSAGTISGGTASGSGWTYSGAYIRALPNGWYRVSVYGLSDTSTLVALNVLLADSSGNVTYNGDGASGLYVWGAQLEQATYSTSYIETTTSTATRAADSALETLTSANFNALEGTLYAEVSVPIVEASAAVSRKVVQIDDGTSNERFILQMQSANNDLDAFIVDGGSTIGVIDGKTLTANTAQKVCLAWKANDAQLVADGVSQGTDTALTLPTVTTLRIGSENGGGTPWNGHIKNLRRYPRRLTAAEMLELTA